LSSWVDRKRLGATKRVVSRDEKGKGKVMERERRDRLEGWRLEKKSGAGESRDRVTRPHVLGIHFTTVGEKSADGDYVPGRESLHLTLLVKSSSYLRS
jgi:hypothetical protein